MALTTRRVALLTAIGCLTLAVAYLPPNPANSPNRFSPGEAVGEQAHLNRLNAIYGRVEQQLADARLYDSLARLIRAPAGRSKAAEVVVQGPLPAASAASLAAAVQHIWRDIGTLPDARLLVIVDAHQRSRHNVFVAPSSLDGRTCVATVALDWSVQWLRRGATDVAASNLEPWMREAIAPCLYYGVFGRPGPHIERWLHEQSFRPASSAAWTSAPPVLRGAELSAGYDFLLSNGSFDALACTDGATDRCYQALTIVQDPQRRSPIVRRSYWSRGFLTDVYFLAALVREMGHERFRQFWRSRAPLDSAFQSAFGQPIDQWTARWARSFVPDLPPFGPTPRPRALSLSLLFAVIALAASTVYVTRRQVR